MHAIETTNLTKHFKDVRAVDDVTVRFQEGQIHGLLGRNGAGKTTFMKLLTGQLFADGGGIRVLGGEPVENVEVLSQVTFIQEAQKYPTWFRGRDILKVAADLYPKWDAAFADDLVEAFGLPTSRVISKLSRGQLSMVGIITGLAARSRLTFFDEPYLGLDAVARQLFFDRVLEDYLNHPRTIILSTHHIDEAAKLLEHVVVLDHGRVLLDADTDELAAATVEVSGRSDSLDEFLGARRVLKRTQLGPLASAVVDNLDNNALADAKAAGLSTAQVSLQQLIVNLTTTSNGAPSERS